MFNFQELVEQQKKGAIVSSTIVEQEQGNLEGNTREGQYFLSLYEARLNAGKAFSRAGATLRELKSAETKAFWGDYAVLSSGFGGAENYKAPPYSEEILRERLAILGWRQKRLPSAYAVFARKHKIQLSSFQAACVLQEDASRKAARRDDDLVISFPDSVLDYFVKILSGDDSIPLDKTLTALSKAVKERLVRDGAK